MQALKFASVSTIVDIRTLRGNLVRIGVLEGHAFIYDFRWICATPDRLASRLARRDQAVDELLGDALVGEGVEQALDFLLAEVRGDARVFA
jgi:hypothetical protein